jgi:7,8-dihydropterin-6-yl-methyl-4-(beta-D-ribofuranosyl)aminobenzene 5'-phosphate synthase
MGGYMKKSFIFSRKFFVICILLTPVLFTTFLTVRFYIGNQKTEKEWQDHQLNTNKLTDWGTTEKLEILPLIDWFKAGNELKTEAGVSYLIKTDNATILFDVGLNILQADTSPLIHNMEKLGVGLDEIDTILISHNHADHVGGIKWQKRKTFSLTNSQINLGEKTVYTPIPMTYPNLTPVCSKEPTIIANGVVTIGTISSQLYFMGRTPEQALAIKVKDKGIVLIVGCGHQTVSKIFQRADKLFDEPIFGFVGGLHYPVTESRIKMAGIQVQRYIGTGKAPWDPITNEDVKRNIEALKMRNLELIGFSGHDSCDASIAAFQKAFPTSFQDIKVGQKIIIEGQQETSGGL